MNVKRKSKRKDERRAFRLSYVPAALCIFALLSVLLMSSKQAALIDNTTSTFPNAETTTDRLLESDDGKLNDSEESEVGGIRPLSCGKFLDTARPTTTDPNEGSKLYTRYTTTDPHFWISLHEKEFDPVRWSVMDYGRYYEFIQSEAFVNIIRESKSDQPRVIDVGGNIGWFSMLSAAAGATVDMFEPNIANHFRACESMCLNGWTKSPCPTLGHIASKQPKLAGNRVNIYPIGISATDANVTFVSSAKNPGHSTIFHDNNNTGTEDDKLREQHIHLMPLDSLRGPLGWTKIDILKVDVEGLELDVFRGAKELLAAKVVQNIFMEGNVKGQSQIASFEEIVALLFANGYRVHKIGGAFGPRNLYKAPDGSGKIEGLGRMCRGGGGHKTQCNLWWKLSSDS